MRETNGFHEENGIDKGHSILLLCFILTFVYLEHH